MEFEPGIYAVMANGPESRMQALQLAMAAPVPFASIDMLMIAADRIHSYLHPADEEKADK